MNVNLLFYYILGPNIQVGRIVDLSTHGLFAVIVADSKITSGSQITFQLQLPNIEPFNLNGEVIRNEPLEDAKMGIAINFINSTDEMREFIAKYLLQSKFDSSAKV